MNYHSFIGQVQHRAQFGTLEDAVRATRVTLNTLGERIQDEEKKKLAAQLPQEIAHYLDEVKGGERFDSDEFFKRISERETKPLPDAVYHARVVCEVLQEAVSAGQMRHVLDQLPEDFIRIFEAGSTGKLKE